MRWWSGRRTLRAILLDLPLGDLSKLLTHHFRVARRAALVPRCQIVLLTPDTSFVSSREEFALALFVKNALHAFTVTLGVETERLPSVPAVNQVQLTRRARRGTGQRKRAGRRNGAPGLGRAAVRGARAQPRAESLSGAHLPRQRGNGVGSDARYGVPFFIGFVISQ